MIVKLLTEHHLEFLSFKGGCRCSSESTLVKMPHCWKSHATAHFINLFPDKVKFCNLVFFIVKCEIVIFSETIEASDIKVAR